MISRAGRWTAIALGLILLAGCAAGPDYRYIDRQLSAGRCEDAAEYIDSRRGGYGRNQRLLFHMDAGMIHLRCGNYASATDHFRRAEDIARDLWTISVSREAASFLINDYTRPYAGEDFERAMIHLMAAFGYIGMDDHEAALVEFRRLDTLLTGLSDRYGEKNVYREDAFARYVSGILFESGGFEDDAFIAYRRAYVAYKDYAKQYGTFAPPELARDVCRLAARVDRQDDAENIGIDCADAAGDRPPGDYRDYGKVVFIGFRGSAPRKAEDGLIVPTSAGPVKIAFPRYVVSPPSPLRGSFILEKKGDGDGSTPEEQRIAADPRLAQNIGRIAVKNLEDRRARVIARMAARTAAKQVTIDRIAREAESDSLRFWLNLVNLFVERADTRSWRTLPGEIYMARLFVPPGTYTVRFPAGDAGGARTETVSVRGGRTEFVFQM